MTLMPVSVYSIADVQIAREEACLLDDAEALQAWCWYAAWHGGGLFCCSLHWQERLQGTLVHPDDSLLRSCSAAANGIMGVSGIARSMLSTVDPGRDDKYTADREGVKTLWSYETCMCTLSAFIACEGLVHGVDQMSMCQHS